MMDIVLISVSIFIGITLSYIFRKVYDKSYDSKINTENCDRYEEHILAAMTINNKGYSIETVVDDLKKENLPADCDIDIGDDQYAA